MSNKIPGFRQMSGSFGTIWWDGERIFEIISFDSKIVANREDVIVDIDVDSKMLSLKGEGSFKIRKVYSRGLQKFVKAWQKGKDPRSQLIAKLDDPDAFGSERTIINNVWFNEVTLMQFEKAQKLEREFPFGFTPSDVEFPDLVA